MASPRQASREDVLDMAAQVFIERGYAGTSLRQLIAATGMSPTAFYARYPSKEAVFEALVERTLSRAFGAFSKAFTGAGPRAAALENMPQVLVPALAADKVMIRLVITEASVLSSMRGTLQSAYAAIAGAIGVALATATTSRPDRLGWAMLGTIYVHMVRWAVFEELDDAAFEEELRAAVALVRAAAAP